MRLNFGKGSLIGALFLASVISNVDSSCKKIMVHQKMKQLQRQNPLRRI